MYKWYQLLISALEIVLHVSVIMFCFFIASSHDYGFCISEFKFGKAPILIATDVASRGLG